MQDPIYFFSKNDPFYEFSNFFPQGFEEDGAYWPTVEHYFQAMKFAGPSHAAYRESIRLARGPKHAKALGQTRDRPLRADWEDVKEEVMLHALRRKFGHPRLRDLLLGTEDRPLVEASPHDHYWGAGAHGSGANRLGALLEQVREELRAEVRAAT